MEIQIADAALRRGHPVAIGPAVVAALTQARTVAGQVTRERITAVLRAEPVAEERPVAVPPARSRGIGAPPRPHRPRPVEVDEPDLFTGLWGGR